MSERSGLLSVEDALERVLAGVEPLPAEMATLHEAIGRTLARPLAALRTQPPCDVSAMDGYALRHADLGEALRIVGESAAGRGYGGTLHPREAVRIFTGAAIPPGADAVLVQESAAVEGDHVTALERPELGRNIRRAGIDFGEGEVLLQPGQRLGPSALALAAAMNHPQVPVTRRPLVAVVATGDELVAPGSVVGKDKIVASNGYAVAALVAGAGGRTLDLGIVQDRLAAVEAAVAAARAAGADVLVTLGGASVGDHDLVKPALARQGMELGFWRIAMRPGKPLIHGRLGAMTILGLPGNPVSSIVCGVLFLVPLLRRLAGDPRAGDDGSVPAVLGKAMPANGDRQDYLRATLARGSGGQLVATPASTQDSSMLRVLAHSQCLLIREPGAAAADAGAPCRILRLGDG